MTDFAPTTDVVILAYSSTQEDSFENIKKKWLAEAQHYCQRKPLVLVATKTDLDATVTKEAVENFCKTSSIASFVEVSAKTGFGIKTLLTTLAEEANDGSKSTKWFKKFLCGLVNKSS